MAATAVLPLRPARLRRVAAGLTDAALVLPIYFALNEAFRGGWDAAPTPLSVSAFAAFELVYHAGFESSTWQATPGKRLAGLRVGDLAGSRLRPIRAATRSLPFWGITSLSLVEFVPWLDVRFPAGSMLWGLFEGESIWLWLTVCLTFLLCATALGPSGRALHDRLAGAVVGRPSPA